MKTIQTLPISKKGTLKRADKFEIFIQGKTLIFEITWNQKGEFFSANIFDKSLNPIVLGKKLVVGVDLLGDRSNDRLPDVHLVPLPVTRSAQNSNISWANMGSDIKVCILDRGGD